MKALIFDLDGTLIDSVYRHTLSWQEAMTEVGFEVPSWEVHRRIGISGKLLVKSLARQRGRHFDDAVIDKLERRQVAIFKSMQHLCNVLPGAVALMRHLMESGIAHGIATTGKRAEIEWSLKKLCLDPRIAVLDGDSIDRAKPEPDVFVACQERLRVPKAECVIVGDSVWDIHAARRAGILAVGVLSGGFGEQELYNAGAMRVYRDVSELHCSIDELGMISNER
jgi:HAD superfamily hydrolase (TIGR01549 family)